MLDFVVFHIQLCEGQPYVLKCYVHTLWLAHAYMELPHYLVMILIPVRIKLWKHDEWTNNNGLPPSNDIRMT